MKKAKELVKPDPILIRRARKRTNYTQTQVAEMLETSQSLVARWESGKSVPKQRTLLKLAAALRCDYDDFFPVDIPALKAAYSKVLEDYLTDSDASPDKRARVAVEILRLLTPPTSDAETGTDPASIEMNKRIHQLMFGEDPDPEPEPEDEEA